MTQDKGYGYTNCQYCGASLKGGHQCNQAPLEGNLDELRTTVDSLDAPGRPDFWGRFNDLYGAVGPDGVRGDLMEVLVWQASDIQDENGEWTSGEKVFNAFSTDQWPADDLERLEAEFDDFVVTNAGDLAEFQRKTGRPLPYIAHDFVLTRNGHGAGFWDRGAGEVGRRLSDACEKYGPVEPLIGDDGQPYIEWG
jgi:hypothetical protein